MIEYIYVGDICGFLLSILVFTMFKLNSKTDNLKTKYIYAFVIVNSLLCITSIITSLLNNNGIFNFSIVFMNYIYCFACIWILQYVILYVVALIPTYYNKMKKFEKQSLLIYGISEIFMTIGMLISHFYTKNDVNVTMNYCKFWSYFNIGSTILICLIIVFLKKNNGMHLKIIRNIGIIAPFLTIGAIIQFTNTHIKFSGFLYSMLIMFFYVFFHGKQIDVSTGGYDSFSLTDDAKALIRKRKEFYLVTIQFQDYEYIRKFIKEQDFNLQLSNVVRKIEEDNKNIRSYRESAEQMSFIIEADKTNGISQGVHRLMNMFKSDNETFKGIYSVMHFKVLILKFPDIIKTTKIISKIRKNCWQKCELDDLYVVTEDDVKIFDIENNFIGIFNDIFAKNDPADERIQVYYQPIYNKKTGKFNTMEALTRLYIDDKLIFPDQFIGVLESNGLIHKYSLLVLEKICIFLKEMESKNIDFDGVSINFSSEEFKMNDFEEHIISITNKYNVKPEHIRIELTESTDHASQKILEEKMISMQEKGFKFYLDDFGTGYSNISKLAYLKFDIVKIDRSIVWDSIKSEDIKKFLLDLTSFINSMNMEVLFEGIEDEEMSNISDDVKYLQGYLYSKPLPQKNIIPFLMEHNK